jgi:hypothetical protein
MGTAAVPQKMLPSGPRDQDPVQFWSLSRVLILTAQQVQIAGGTHQSEELVLAALRRGEVRARGLFHGDTAVRWVAPTEWNRLKIEIETNPILLLLIAVVRRLPGGPAAPPAVTNVELESRGVQAWLTRLRPTLRAPKAAPAKLLTRLPPRPLLSAEVKCRKELGNIPATITELSRELESFMLSRSKTNPRVRPMKARSIENRLRDWKLFPNKNRTKSS